MVLRDPDIRLMLRVRGDEPGAFEELVAILRQALGQLNERQRLAVVLNKFEDMNYNEIAEVMGLTVQAVKSLLSRARTNLRVELGPYVFMDGEAPPDGGEEP